MNDAMTDDDRVAVMTYVDGEMTPADAAAFDTRLAHEPALAAAVARERTLRLRLQGAFAPVLDEPVPAGLLALLEGAGEAPAAPVAANEPLPAGRNDAPRAALPHARRWRWPEWGAMAACLVLGLVVGTRVLAPSGGASLALAGDALTAQGRLRDALEQRTGGGDQTADAVAVGLSFRDHAHDYCRTFTLAGDGSGIACKRDGTWSVAQLSHDSAASAPAPGAYRTAASPFSPALLQAVDAMRDGDTLDAAAEAAAKARGWQR
jgi:anti-sigma factor RsiW